METISQGPRLVRRIREGPSALTVAGVLLATDALGNLFYPGGFVTIFVGFGDSQLGLAPDLSLRFVVLPCSEQQGQAVPQAP